MIKITVFIFPLNMILINEFGDHGGSRLKVDGGKIPKLLIITYIELNIQFWTIICFSTITMSNKQILREIWRHCKCNISWDYGEACCFIRFCPHSTGWKSLILFGNQSGEYGSFRRCSTLTPLHSPNLPYEWIRYLEVLTMANVLERVY